MGQSPQATKTLHLSWTLAGKLAWTMSKHSAPFDCYSNILQPGDDHAEGRRANAALMKTHHENVLALESAMHEVPDAKDVWEACLFLSMQPVRVLLEYFRRDKYSPSSPQGRHLLMGGVATLADNKIVEDIHAPLRLATKGNCNDRLSRLTIQDVINHSDVIEARNINHRTAVSKELLPGPAILITCV